MKLHLLPKIFVNDRSRLYLLNWAANEPISHPPDGTRMNKEVRWNDTDRAGRKTCPSITLSFINTTRTTLGTNQGLRGEKQATIRLSYSMVISETLHSL
jgi:hypothetical protein